MKDSLSGVSTLANGLPEILLSCRFYVVLSIDGPAPDGIDAYFLDCKGMKATQEIIEVCEVRPQNWGKANAKSGRVMRTKVPGNVKVNNITLRRGLTSSSALWDWFADVRNGNWKDQRRNGSISILDQASNTQVRFTFFNAFPASYVLSDLNASSNEVEIEELELAVEGLERTKD